MMDIEEIEVYEPLRLAMEENARIMAILYSIFRRHPDVINGSLELEGVDEDYPPERMVLGWNTIGTSAIVTLIYGDALYAMIKAGEANESKTE